MGSVVYGVAQRMNPVLETWLVAARDLRKNIRSLKGIVMFSIALLGALVSTFKLKKFDEIADDVNKLDPTQLHSLKAQAFSKLYGDEGTGDVLAGAPVKLLILFFIAVWLAPLLFMIVGFDGISADLQHRSVRYWASRTRRYSYYAGKFVALWTIVALVTLVMQLIVWGVTILRGEAPAADTLAWGFRFWAASLPITGAWCGIATLVSSLFKAPMLSLLGTCAVFFLLFFTGLIIGKAGDVTFLKYLYPNNFDGWIISAKREQMLEGLGVCLAYIMLTTGVGATIFTQRDV